MPHRTDHVVNRIRTFIAAWPLSFVGGAGAVGTIAGWWFF